MGADAPTVNVGTIATCAVPAHMQVTDLPLRVLIAAHFIRGSVVSTLLYPRRTSPSAETKPGKAPKNVDYVGERGQGLIGSGAP